MPVNELSVIDYVINTTGKLALTDTERLTIADRIGLDETEWAEQLAADGFGEADVVRLDDLIWGWLSPDKLLRLAEQIRDIQDPGDEDELAPIAEDWMGYLMSDGVSRQIYDAGFPNVIDAICYAISAVGRALLRAIAAEEMRRQIGAAPPIGWDLDASEIAQGQAIADEGLAKDAQQWPTY